MSDSTGSAAVSGRFFDRAAIFWETISGVEIAGVEIAETAKPDRDPGPVRSEPGRFSAGPVRSAEF
jgi:hypothetical protein